MKIRKARIDDFPRIEEIMIYAREQMRLNGNPTQWGTTRPGKSTLLRDIEEGIGYVLEEEAVIHGYFAFFIGIEPTYAYIEDGHWLNDLPYGVIHRVASAGTKKCVMEQILSYCGKVTNNLRIDTHRDNHIMQHIVEKHGFTRCGIVFVEDGTKRIAYQRKNS